MGNGLGQTAVELPAHQTRLNDRPAVIEDAQLIDQTLRGQTEAFGQLVLKYQDRLFNTVFHVVGHAEDARDIVQEALVQAFLKLDSFEHRTRFIPGSIVSPSTWPWPIGGGGERRCRWTACGTDP